MKKFFMIIMCALMICAIAFPLYAEEITDETVSDSEIVTEAEQAPSGEVENYTFLGRVWEWVGSHKTEVVNVGCNGLLFAFMWLFKRKTGTGNAQLAATLGTVASQTANNPQVVSAVNSLIDGYNVMSEKYEKYGIAEGDRDKFITALMEQNTAILEILNTVYTNSNNLPQGVKDIIRVKYARCLQIVSDDSELKKIVEAVKKDIGGTSEVKENDKQG